jgi:hypothetical protein
MQLTRALMAMVLVPAAVGCASSGPEVEAPRGSNDGFWARALGTDNEPNAGPCPLMGVLYDSARLVEFAGDGRSRYGNVAFTGEMRGVRGLCRYVGEDPIVMNIEIDMAFGRGPAADSQDRSYTYWVAVARRGSTPIEKQYYTVDVRFPNGQDVMETTQAIETIVIPRANADISGENFEILVGFELTPEQLNFNRDGARFRVNAPEASN